MKMQQRNRIALGVVLAGLFAAGGIASAQTVSVPGVSAGARTDLDTSRGTSAVPRGDNTTTGVRAGAAADTNTGTGTAPTGVGGGAGGVNAGGGGVSTGGGAMNTVPRAAGSGGGVRPQGGTVGGRAQGAGGVGMQR